MTGSGLDRRAFIGAAGAAAAGAAAAGPIAEVAAAPRRRRRRRRRFPALGSGGTPMTVPELAALARERGGGYPVLILDLAALDQNSRVVVDFASAQGWGVRPALKSFRSAKLISYILVRLPEPRGLVFNLREIDPIVAAAPSGTDLMTGYPPTFGELAAYLREPPPRRARAHRVRILIDSVALMEELARLLPEARRTLPQEVALELDVGMGRGGMNDRDEIGACLDIIRANPDLYLTAVLGYDGHATLDGDPNYRRGVAAQATDAYRAHLEDLRSLGVDTDSLVRNGPGSSNYRNWAGGPANEISPGSAFLLAGYLNGGYDTEGLAPALTMGGSVRRITSDHPSVPVTGDTPPNASEEEIIVQAIGAPSELFHPAGAREDDLSGGGDALIVPKGSVKLGDYVLYRPHQTEDGILKFDGIQAAREGTVRRRWPVFPRSA